jgi:hypothetical protein
MMHGFHRGATGVALLLLAALAAGCVSSSDPANGAVRLLNAVPDGPRMDLSIDGELALAAVNFGGGSAFVAKRRGTYQVSIEEIPFTATTATDRTIYDRSLEWAANDEVSLVVVGEAGAQSEEVIEIRNRTSGVPIGRTRLQFVHAAVGGQPVDVYVTEPDTALTGLTPVAAALAFKAFTAQQEVEGGTARIVLTAAGNPAAILFDSGSLFLTLEGNLLVAVVPPIGTAAGTSPFSLAILTGTSAANVLDAGTPASVRFVNAAPGAYALDAFVNQTSVDDTARQACDPASVETDTLLEVCAAAFTTVSAETPITGGAYDVKLQKTAADAVAAQALTGSLATGVATTLVLTGLTADDATATTQGLVTLAAVRSIAGVAQLRVVDASLAADAAVSGDPTSDRLELYIAAPGASLDAEDPDFTFLSLGSNTGHVALVPGTYQVALAKTDTATSNPPEVLYTREVTLAGGGRYTLVIADSVGGVQPLQGLSIEDAL